MDSEHQKMREGVAMQYGIQLFRQYGEAEAAHFLSVDISTLKRWRRKGITPHIRMGERGVRYLGLHIVDLLIRGTGEWDDTPGEVSSSAHTGSGSGEKAPPGIGSGTMPKPDAQAVLRLARTTLKKPNSD